MSTNNFILVVNSRKVRSKIKHQKTFENIPDKLLNVFNIYEIFIHIFSYTSLSDKLSFGSASVQCKKWIDQRLSDKILCDDFDEQIIYYKPNKINCKSLIKFFRCYPTLFQILNFNTFSGYTFDYVNRILIKLLIKYGSIVILKKYIRRNYTCRTLYIIFYSVHDQYDASVYYKNAIYKLFMDRLVCKNKTKCKYCMGIIYLCLENDLDLIKADLELSDNFNCQQIFDMMIIAAAHGSPDIFTYLYEYLETEADKYFTSQLVTNVILILTCYYENYTGQKIYKETRKNPTCKRSYLNYKRDSQDYTDIYDYLTPDVRDDEIFFNAIVNRFDQKFIDDMVRTMIIFDDIDGANFFEEAITEVSDQIIKLLISKYSSFRDIDIKNMLDKLLIKKYGKLTNHLVIKVNEFEEHKIIINSITNKITNDEIIIDLNTIINFNIISNNTEEFILFKKYFKKLKYF